MRFAFNSFIFDLSANHFNSMVTCVDTCALTISQVVSPHEHTRRHTSSKNICGTLNIFQHWYYCLLLSAINDASKWNNPAWTHSMLSVAGSYAYSSGTSLPQPPTGHTLSSWAHVSQRKCWHGSLIGECSGCAQCCAGQLLGQSLYKKEEQNMNGKLTDM